MKTNHNGTDASTSSSTRCWMPTISLLIFGLITLLSAVPNKNCLAVESRSFVKILVENDQMYRVTGAQLKEAGVSIHELQADQLNLYNQGNPIHMRLEGVGSNGEITEQTSLAFWGEYPRGSETRKNLYTKQNAYLLILNDELPPFRFQEGEMTSIPTESEPLRTYSRKVHFEEDWQIKFFQTYKSAPSDRLMWSSFKSPPKDGHQTQFPALEDLARPDQFVTMRLYLWGNSHPPVSPDHKWALSINDVAVGQAEWDGTTHYEFVAEVPGTAFHTDKPNILHFFNMHEEFVIDAISVDWIEFEYEAIYQIEDKAIEANLPERNGPFSIQIDSKGKTDIDLFNLTRGIYDNIEIESNSTEYSASIAYFKEASATEQIVALLQDQYHKPSSITLENNIDLHNITVPEYLIITHNQFMGEAERLHDYRKSKLSSAIINVEDIYNSYSFGLFSPHAIRAFIDNLMERGDTNSQRIKYVFLIGDANYDYTNIKQGSPNYVPTFHSDQDSITTEYAPVYARDDWFGFGPNSADKPQVAIGRLPVNEIASLSHYINKIIEYESINQNNEQPEWKSKALLLAAEGFSSTTEDFARDITSRMNIDKIYAQSNDIENNETLRQRIVDAYGNGAGIIYFVGHGAEFMWRTGTYDPSQQSDMFTDTEIEKLQNKGKYPIVLASTCFSALFDTPGHSKSGVGVYMVEAQDRGAIACIAHVGKAPITSGHNFAKHMMREMLSIGTTRIGDAFLAAKQSMHPAETAAIALIGDPALETNFGQLQTAAQIHPTTTPLGFPMQLSQSLNSRIAITPQPQSSTAIPNSTHRVKLRWKTETETNSFGYLIYRCETMDGDFKALNENNPLSAAGTSTTPHLYVFYDTDVSENSEYYYKVKQIDLNGSETWLIGGETPAKGTAKPITSEELQEIQEHGTAFSQETL